MAILIKIASIAHFHFLEKTVNAKCILLKENSHFYQDRPHRSFPRKNVDAKCILLEENGKIIKIIKIINSAFSLKEIAIFFKIVPAYSLCR